MALRKVELPGSQVIVRTDIGQGQIVRAVLTIDDGNDRRATEPPFDNDPPRDQWERDFEELCALAPLNQHVVDDSRESIYGPDPGEPSS